MCSVTPLTVLNSVLASISEPAIIVQKLCRGNIVFQALREGRKEEKMGRAWSLPQVLSCLLRV